MQSDLGFAIEAPGRKGDHSQEVDRSFAAWPESIATNVTSPRGR